MEDTLNGRAAANLRASLAARRMTHEDLALKAGLSRGQVTSMLSGRSPINLLKLELMAGALDVEPSKLLND
jgi:transcriptional regulator with XRE-family HTH domain